jgi:3-oxoacyl-[acyl-carrier-protein] synthase III
MSTSNNIGLQGVGFYLPDNIRKNDWWPDSIVDKWREKPKRNLVHGKHMNADPDTEGAKRTLEAMAEFVDDPFKGAKERRIKPDGMSFWEMEVLAAEDALKKAGVDKSEIDMLLVYSQVPDYLAVHASVVHEKLGLPERCFTTGIEGACNSFLLQLGLAEQMIRGGQAKKALLIQSSGFFHITKPEDHHSAWFGDGATAVVVGPVGEGKGILGRSHRTDGSFHKAVYPACAGKRWYDGPVLLWNEERATARKMLLSIADLAKTSLDEALEAAGHRPEEMDFYATHQSTLWFRKVTQEYARLSKARTFDSFAWTTSLGASNIPFMLAMGEKERLLKDGDLVAMHTGGGGITWSSMILRWGR